MPSVDLSLDALTRLRDQLKADLDAVERALGLLKNQGAKAPSANAPMTAAPVATTPENVLTMPPAESPVRTEAPADAASPVPVAEPSLPAPTPAPPAPAPVPRVDIRAQVREIIGSMEGRFGIGAVKMRLHKLNSYLPEDSFIRGIMRKMVAEGTLRQVATNYGRGGNVFELSAPPPGPDDPADPPPPAPAA